MLGFTAQDGLLFTSRFHTDKKFAARFLADWETCGPVNLLGLARDSITQQASLGSQ